ncbi:MAG: ParA family protein [Simkaniaceae bacterium]|nr:ParA family protein [Simkaniaceae bacterium]
MVKVITFCSFKGGTAKTSTCLHLGSALAKFHHQRVLLVDFDAQANLSTGLGLGVDHLNTMAAVLKNEKTMHEVIQDTSVEGLKIVPANIYLDGIESTSPIVGDLYGHERLKKALRPLKEFDYILIDTPPSLGWLTQSALFAAHHSMICAMPEAFSILALDRLRLYHEKIREHHHLEVLGVVLSFWSDRSTTNHAFLDAIEAAFPHRLFETKIHRDVSVSRSVLKGIPVFSYANHSRAAQDYQSLAAEFLARVESKEVAYV